MAHFGTRQGESFQWFLRRHSALTPAQLASVYLSLCGLSLGLAWVFWLQGAVLAVPLALAELLALGLGFLLYARHAGDGERIYLRGDRLVVERTNAGHLERAEFSSAWVRVEPKVADGSLIEVSGQGRSVCVGRFVPPALRPALASEIRVALRGV